MNHLLEVMMPTTADDSGGGGGGSLVCDAIGAWDAPESSEGRHDAIADALNDFLTTYGYDAVDVVFAKVPENEYVPGYYSPGELTVYFNPEMMDDLTGEEAISTAIHEGIHAINHQEGGDALSEGAATALGFYTAEDILSECADPPDSTGDGDLPEWD